MVSIRQVLINYKQDYKLSTNRIKWEDLLVSFLKVHFLILKKESCTYTSIPLGL